MSDTSWDLTGNSGTNSATNFIGTTDNEALVIKTNAKQVAVIGTDGSVGIGTASPNSILEVSIKGSFELGPAITVTNSASDGNGNAAALDLNTSLPTKPYNPSARIEAVEYGGNFTNHIVFSANVPGAANGGLAERLRLTPTGPFVMGGSTGVSPIFTLNNWGLTGGNTGVAVDLNTYAPSGAGSPLKVIGGGSAAYNPSSRIQAVDVGNYSNDIVFLSNKPGAANNGLVERIEVSPAGVGMGTASPRSALEVSVAAGGALGPAITLTNTGGAANAAAALDFNTFSPAATGTYNPSSRIEAVDDGNYANDVVFLSNKPGAANNGLVERMRVSPAGVGIGTPTPVAPFHLVPPALNNVNLPVALIEANSSNNASPRLGLVDTSQGSNAVAPVWFIDNNQDNFRIFRQPNASTGGVTYLTISNAGLMTVPGDIVLTGADCAERFTVIGPDLPEPGTVLVIDKEGLLRECCEPYDKKVAGVVSGAGDYRHGILLDGGPSDQPCVALALTGKVYCKVDAQYSSVEVGDLLTTSPTAGHAMKATEVAKSFGSVIGKALRGLEVGQGLVPILVSLQ